MGEFHSRRKLLKAAGYASFGALGLHGLEPAAADTPASGASFYEPVLLYDTSEGSFMSAEPSRHLGTALRRHSVSGQTPRVIFAGEVHTNPMHHKMQLELIKAVKELDEQPIAIGLEMCYR